MITTADGLPDGSGYPGEAVWGALRRSSSVQPEPLLRAVLLQKAPAFFRLPRAGRQCFFCIACLLQLPGLWPLG